jgi:hypothetical protein
MRKYLLEQLTLNLKKSGTYETSDITRADSKAFNPITRESIFPTYQKHP